MLKISGDGRYIINNVVIERRLDSYYFVTTLGLDLGGSLVAGKLYSMKGSVSYRQLVSGVYLIGQVLATVSMAGELLDVSLVLNVIEGEDGFGSFILRDITTVVKPQVVTDILEELLTTGLLEELIKNEIERVGVCLC